jgi:DNA mismatch repair ATPase MutS
MSKDTDSNSTKSKSLTKEYMDLHDKYVKQFGKDRTLVLMQVGKFYEAYGTDILGPTCSNLSL